MDILRYSVRSQEEGCNRGSVVSGGAATLSCLAEHLSPDGSG